MAAVIGFVSLILAIVAIITSVTLGTTMNDQLNSQLRSTAVDTTRFVTEAELLSSHPDDLTAQQVLQGKTFQGGAGLLLAIAPTNGAPSGVILTPPSTLKALSAGDLFEIQNALRNTNAATVSLPDYGSYSLIVTRTPDGSTVVTGLSRAGIQSTMAQLFTVIALATLGGLILLALTTAVTISVGLRPLRAVVATATRVANQPLDRGEVSITERVADEEADPRTETGLVGAALNTLLDHVDTSLAARQQNEERMRRFVADASHELRTPLASIRGYSELSLRDKELPETAHTALERIQAQSLRMTRLVEDLLLLARLDEGRELAHAPVDLTMLAVEELTDARPTASDHVWELDVPEEPIMIDGDAGRLHQVVGNLLANARTHTPAGTTITLSVAATTDGAELRVHDDGPGIDPKVREELFARFARGDVSRARQTGGTGLGLAIAKAIVEGHGGTISVESVPGDTTFLVRLPVASVQTSPTA
ncbi:sensor histidine kinase [Microbacterium sp. MAH-37]|uniref:sensor histidine kinase n=2 Tax=unclassified Microbacterium TaxID=2609290 RepID=UPI0012FB1EDE|nr:ATP-binding protein [Microbacterium sp. MAH-37]MVQ41115.1 HAMP domain-containing protein [Microbacterium sp. MAH-37]